MGGQESDTGSGRSHCCLDFWCKYDKACLNILRCCLKGLTTGSCCRVECCSRLLLTLWYVVSWRTGTAKSYGKLCAGLCMYTSLGSVMSLAVIVLSTERHILLPPFCSHSMIFGGLGFLSAGGLSPAVGVSNATDYRQKDCNKMTIEMNSHAHCCYHCSCPRHPSSQTQH